MLIVLSAPSGTGKTTIARALMQDVETLRFSVSATTRPQRNGEENGSDYHFLSREEFERRIEQNDLVEYEEIFGNLYGTLRSETKLALQRGEHLLFDVDVKGGLSLKESYPNDTVLIFVKPPSLEELKARIENRGTDTEEQIETRLARAEFELGQMQNFDHVVVNDDLRRAVEEVKKIVRDETGTNDKEN
jgi:guanylate kinase